MSEINWKDVLERAAWTAAQAFLGAVPPSQVVAAIETADVSQLEAFGLSAAAAAIAAVLSFAKTIAQEKLGVFDTRA